MISGNVRPRTTARCSDVGVLARVTGINGLATGTTDLFTVPAAMDCVVTAAVIHLTTIVGFVTVGALGIGINAGAEDDIFPSTTLTGLDTATEIFLFAQDGVVRRRGTAGDVIRLGIDTAYTATTATLAVDLIGYVIKL